MTDWHIILIGELGMNHKNVLCLVFYSNLRRLAYTGKYQFSGKVGFIFRKYSFKASMNFDAELFLSTMICDYINIMKTIFDFNFDLYRAVKQHGYTQKSRKSVYCKSFYVITCKLAIQKKLVNNQNFKDCPHYYIDIISSHCTFLLEF